MPPRLLQLTALEFGPANGMDITENMLNEAPAGPVLLRPAPQPEPECLPMLHVRVPVHGLEESVVQQVGARAACEGLAACVRVSRRVCERQQGLADSLHTAAVL